MLVYYFLPFIVNNRYLLFQVSSGHNSVTVQNRTHVRYELFCVESLILSFPKVVQIPPESPRMYHQFNIQQFYVLPTHTVFMCFVWISEQTAIVSLYTIN